MLLENVKRWRRVHRKTLFSKKYSKFAQGNSGDTFELQLNCYLRHWSQSLDGSYAKLWKEIRLNHETRNVFDVLPIPSPPPEQNRLNGIIWNLCSTIHRFRCAHELECTSVRLFSFYFCCFFVFAFCFFYFELFCIQTFPNTHTRFLPLYFWFCALFLSIFSLSNLQFHSSVSFRIPKLLPCLCCQLCVVLRALIQFIQISPLTLSVAGFCDAPNFYSIASERLYSPTLQSTEPFYS